MAKPRGNLQLFVKNISTNVYLNAAVEMGLEIKVFSEKQSLARIYGNGGALTLWKAFIGHECATAATFIPNKPETSRMLRSHEIPVTDQALFYLGTGKAAVQDSEKIFEFAETRYPVVVKPPIGCLGKGVFVGIHDDQQLAYALAETLKSSFFPERRGRKTLLVEKQVLGDEYRVLVCKGVIVDILHKSAGSVLGNGIDNVAKLIERENSTKGEFDVPIRDLERITSHLLMSGRDLDTVPDDGERVTLDNSCFFPTGGTMQHVSPREVAPELSELFQCIASCSGLMLAGIDFICPDITRPCRRTDCAVLEVNTGNSIAIHYMANPGPDLEPAKQVIRLYLDEVDVYGEMCFS